MMSAVLGPVVGFLLWLVWFMWPSRPGLWARIRAQREQCTFVDKVNRRCVWSWRTPEGGWWLGQSRFGLWVSRR